jgi:hypothetical protein
MKKVMLLVCLVLAAMLFAGETEEKLEEPKEAEASEDGSKLSLVVMDFEVIGFKKEVGPQVTEIVNALLSADEKLQVVERKELKKILEELELGESGFVSEETMAKIQNLVGAKFYVGGKIFKVGLKTYITVSLVSNETGLKKTVMAIGPVDDDLNGLANTAGRDIVKLVKKHGPSMMAKEEKPDAEIDKVKKGLKGKKLPKVMVYIKEEHIGRPVIDPAAQTEMIRILIGAGLDVDEYLKEVKSDLLEGGSKEFFASLEGTDVVIKGEAFSEFALRRGNLISCKARVEIKAVDVKTRKLIYTLAGTSAGIDVTEGVASKKALEKATKKVAADFIVGMVKRWNEMKEK